MPLNAQEFVLPGFGGGDPAAGLTNLSNRMWMRGMQTQRLALAKEAKREQAGNFLEKYTDQKDYLTGTAYDPMINGMLQKALQQGASMASQGADIPQLLMGLGPMMQQVTEYSAKAKAINKQADDAIKTMKESGLTGYDYAKLKDQALKAAFHKRDPKTGQDIGLNDIKDVDPGQNWIMKTVQDHPDLVTNAEGIDAFAKNYAQMKQTTDATTYDSQLRKTHRKVNLVGQGYLVPDTDDNGAIKELVPKYDHATDQGQPIIHDFTTEGGQAVKAPVRLLDEGVFNEAVNNKGVGDWLRGQVKQHLQEYKDSTGKEIDMGSPQAHQVARALMYDELKRRRSGGVQYLDEVNKPPAAEVNLHYYGTKEQQAHDTETGRLKAREDMGVPLPGTPKPDKPLNAVETIHQLFNNNANFLSGDIVPKNGHDVIDVKGNFPNGELKFGNGQADAFKNIYFDPQRRVLMTEDAAGKISEHKENELKPYLKSIAQVNKVNANSIDASFQKAGYNDGKGVYGKPGQTDTISLKYKDYEEKRQAVVQKGIDNLTTNGKGSDLKGIRTSEGEIQGAGEVSWYSAGKYYLDLKGNDGKVQKKKFGSKEELESFLKGGGVPQKSATANPKSGPTLNKLSKEEEDALKEQGL